MNRTVKIEGDFEFEVGIHDDWCSPHWCVFLPHQCDEWEIDSDETTSKAAMVERMERFVAEAQQALDVLRAMPDETYTP